MTYPRRHLHPKRRSSSIRIRLPLHLLADLHIDLKEFGHAAVEADRLALVEIGFAVVLVEAFLRAGVDET